MNFALHLPVWILLAATLGACAGANEPPTAPAAAPPPSAPDTQQAAPHADEPPPAAPQQASAESSPPVLNLATVDATLRAIVGEGRGLSAAEFLMKLGFDSEAVAPLSSKDVNDARRIEDNLDADQDLESVIIIDAVLSVENRGAPGRQVYVVWIEQGDPLVPVGRMRFEAESCVIDGSIDVAVRPVHAADFADTVIAVEGSRGCDGNLRAVHRSVVLSLERGKVETLLDFSDESETDRVSGKTLDPALTVTFSGNPPQTADVQDEKKRRKKRLVFDKQTFKYR